MAQRPKLGPHRVRGPIARLFDAFTVTVFSIVVIALLLGVAYTLSNSGYQPAKVPALYWFR